MPRLPVALAVVAALALAACSGSGSDADLASDTAVDATTETPDAATVPDTDSGDGGVTGAEVPGELDFVAPDVRGGQVVGAELAGRDLVIWFWAPW